MTKSNDIGAEALNDQNNKITVTMDMLHWCRLMDVLHWFKSQVLYFQSLGILITDITDGKPITMAIPADQYTASVIARICGTNGYWKIKYMPDIGVLVAYDNIDDMNSDSTFWCETNPDPIGNATEWSREWINEKLKEIT